MVNDQVGLQALRFTEMPKILENDKIQGNVYILENA